MINVFSLFIWKKRKKIQKKYFQGVWNLKKITVREKRKHMDEIKKETITLWTRQVPQVWEELEATGVYRVKEEYIRAKNDTISDFYLRLYR